MSVGLGGIVFGERNSVFMSDLNKLRFEILSFELLIVEFFSLGVTEALICLDDFHGDFFFIVCVVENILLIILFGENIFVRMVLSD